MVKTLFFFPNGNYAACDEAGNQVPDEQGSAWMNVLQEKLSRGVITEQTRLKMAGWNHPKGEEWWTVGELIASGRLKK